MLYSVAISLLQCQHPFCAAYLRSESRASKDTNDSYVGWKQH